MKSRLGKILQQYRTSADVGDQFVAMLDQTIEQSHPYQKPSLSLKPSSLGTCLRRSYYELTGAEVNHTLPSAELVGMGESGTDRHVRLQRQIQAMARQGFACEWVDVEEYLKQFPQPGVTVRRRAGAEVGLAYEPLGLHLYLDGIVKFMGKYYILELKTETSFKWTTRKGPAPEHAVQVACYSLVVGLSDVLMIYENRDTCKKKGYHVVVTHEERQAIRDYVEKVRWYVQQSALPPRTEDLTNCRYCPYTNICDLARDSVDAWAANEAVRNGTNAETPRTQSGEAI